MAKYYYRVTEESCDTRVFDIESDRQLDEIELIDAVCLPDITKEGDSETSFGITATFLYTDYGADSYHEISEIKDVD